jgi:hypothetical protein
MCVLCQSGSGSEDLAPRVHVLQLLALVEHPDALPADAALRLGREIMTLIRSDSGLRRCDAVAPGGPAVEETR